MHTDSLNPNTFLITDVTLTLSQFQAWVIESDRLRPLGELNQDDTIDLETDVTPFVAYDGDPATFDPNVPDAFHLQAEVFIGKKTALADWKEDASGRSINLTTMSSSNPLFPDYA